MATTALGGVVNISHRSLHGSGKMMDEDSDYSRMDGHSDVSMESYQLHHQSNSPGVLMTAVRSVKAEVSPASPDSTMSSSSSTATEDSHVSVLRRGPSAAPPSFVPFTAPPRIASATSNSSGLRLHQHHQPASVARRNARERNRVKQVNNGFATLRQHIPAALIAAAAAERSESPSERPSNGRCSSSSSSAAAKKMSKVETLRCAVEYIRCLQDMLMEADGGKESPDLSESRNDVEQDSGTSPAIEAHSGAAPSPVSSIESSSAFLPPSPPPSSAEPLNDSARQYLSLQPVQPFEYLDIDTYARLQNYGAEGASTGVLHFYQDRIKKEEIEDTMVMEPHHGVVASTNSPPPHGYSTSATAYLAMAPGPALIQRQLVPGEDVQLVENDVAGMMTWWTEEPQC